jgi:transcriptional regulator
LEKVRTQACRSTFKILEKLKTPIKLNVYEGFTIFGALRVNPF